MYHRLVDPLVGTTLFDKQEVSKYVQGAVLYVDQPQYNAAFLMALVSAVFGRSDMGTDHAIVDDVIREAKNGYNLLELHRFSITFLSKRQWSVFGKSCVVAVGVRQP